MTDEKRKFSRVPFPIIVHLAGEDGGAVNGNLRDLSIKGMFVATDQQIKPGTLVTMDLQLAGRDIPEMIRLWGEVVRTEEDGVAIDFREMNLESFGHLKNIVMYNNDGKIASE